MSCLRSFNNCTTAVSTANNCLFEYYSVFDPVVLDIGIICHHFQDRNKARHWNVAEVMNECNIYLLYNSETNVIFRLEHFIHIIGLHQICHIQY